jgi:cobalt-zinc-cadmium efflux system membrane fusion protein
MNKHILWGVIALLFAQCSNQNTNPQAEETKSSNPNVVHLTDPQIKELGIAVEPMKMDTIETTITLTGNLICPNQSQTQLSFPLSVQIEKILIEPGQMVQAGQTIATVSDLALVQLQEDYWTTKSEFSLMESEWNRQQNLKKDNATSDKAWMEAQVQFEKTKAKLTAQTERMKLLGISTLGKMEINSSVAIKAPHAGQLANLNVTNGQRIQPGESIATLLDNRKLWAEISMFNVQNAQNLMHQKVTIKDALNTQCNGQVIQIDGQVSSEDHAVHAWIEIDQVPAEWKPGLPITALISSHPMAAAVFQKASVVNFENSNYVFVQKGKNEFEMTEVQIIHEEGDSIWTDTHIQVPAQVISKSAYYVLQAMKNKEE